MSLMASLRPLLPRALRAIRPSARHGFFRGISTAEGVEDPNMNGSYSNPPPIKRQHRNPYDKWWDSQDRRNFGEPVHEDNDILGILSTEHYTHFTLGHGAFLFACSVAVVLGVSGLVAMVKPKRPSAPTEFPDGLEKELGGPGALRAHKAGDPIKDV